MKTTNTILSDIYTIINASPIQALNGGIYKKIRPTDSQLEDCVISLISGTDSKFIQDGGLYIKIFYKDLFQANTYMEDALNGSAKELLLWNLSETLLNTEGYNFYPETRELYTEVVPEIHQHFAILKINFKILY